MEIFPGGLNVDFQICYDPGALLNICPHVLKVQQELPVVVFVRDIKVSSGPAVPPFLRARGPPRLHGMRQLLHLVLCDKYRLLLLLLKLLHLRNQLSLFLLQVEILLNELVKVLVELLLGLATQSYQLVLLQLVDLTL
jgi:hypothetical protein